MSEEWREILGYEGIYEVSSAGNIRSLPRDKRSKCGSTANIQGKMLKSSCSNTQIHKYHHVQLSKNGVKETRNVHRIVAIAFIENKENRPNINHIDNNPENNRVENLEWVTQTENLAHAVKQGRTSRGENVHTSKLTARHVVLIRELWDRKLYNSVEMAKIFKVSQTMIKNINRRVSWKHIS